ncbi:MAG TPA: MBL fold metallo-hydrolase [Phycisphaerales bacterium]|nr:MBL fold metallo-hydrolase [Phycisphaerales bacterium]
MSAQVRIISIGTLNAHPLWHESTPVRTGHATCSLIESGRQKIIVNPSLPAAAILARLSERTPVKPDEITAVFATSFNQEHCRAVSAFDRASWFASEPELDAAANRLRNLRDQASSVRDRVVIDQLDFEQSILDRFKSAPDNLAQGVDLFPLPGVTAGLCGLIISQPVSTILITGDAVATIEHLERAQILPNAANAQQAMESFREAVEIADVIVPGRDNMLLNPARARMS